MSTQYTDLHPGNVPAVVVEWLDITGSSDELGLERRWSIGWLLDNAYESEGLECMVIAQTWDERDWADFATIPKCVVVGYEHQR